MKYLIPDFEVLGRLNGEPPWRQLEGIAKVQLESGRIRLIELYAKECKAAPIAR